MALDEFIKDNPKFHRHRESLVSYRLEDAALNYTAEYVKPGDKTLETGAGVI